MNERNDLVKILVIDDEYELMEGALDFAHMMNPQFQFYKTKTIKEGLEIILTLNPQIIFLDRNFNGSEKNGLYIIKELKTNLLYENNKTTPVIGIGSFYENEREDLVEYRPKPLSYKDFEDMIKKYVG